MFLRALLICVCIQYMGLFPFIPCFLYLINKYRQPGPPPGRPCRHAGARGRPAGADLNMFQFVHQLEVMGGMAHGII